MMNISLVLLVFACALLLAACVFQERSLITEKQKRHFLGRDELTGVYNWAHMLEKINLLSKTGEPYYVIYTDIFGFKLVNELFGRETGDSVIQGLADAFRKHVPENALYCRVNNDHFMIILKKEQFTPDFLYAISDDVANSLTDYGYRVHIYFGIYETNEFKESLSSICDKASMALDTIKGNMGEKIAIYNEDMMEKVVRRKKIIDEFDEAMRCGEFQMYLQPQFSATDQTLTGAEALVRRIRPDGTIIPPMEFIPIYEKAGLICRLDRFMWEEAARKLHSWNERSFHAKISVNLSPIDFKYLNIAEEFNKLAEKYKLEHGQLNIEITESAIVSDIPGLRTQLDQLKKSGFHLEIDDFGNGYSSLNALKDIEADILKIDRGFLKETENEERSRIILDSIINMAKKLKMPVVTEGVEKPEQVDILTRMGCDIFQGYYFSRPISVAEYEARYM